MATNEEKLDEVKRKADKAAAERSKAEEQKKATAKTGNLFAPGTAFATFAPVRQQTSPAPTGPFSIIGIWTAFSLDDAIDEKNRKSDVLFKEDGGIKRLHDGTEHHSWVQNGNSVTVEFNDNFATYELKIINPHLMQGICKNILGYEGSVEFKRK
jgi:hypothetical protein